MIVSKRELVLVLILFAVLTVVFTWPVATRMVREIPVSGSPLDPMHMLYGISWGVHALAHTPLGYFHATFFYPYLNSLAFLDHAFGLAVLAAPVGWGTGNMMTGYDVVWLLTFVLSGLGAYLLVRYLTDSVPAALLAGILYAFHPFRYHSAGSIHVLAGMWLPFALLSLHLWVETRLRRQLFLFLAFALAQFLSSSTMGMFLPFVVILYVLVLLVTNRPAVVELLSRQRWVILAVMSLGLLLIAPFITPYLEYAQADYGLRRTLADTAPYSAIPRDFLTPADGSVLRGLAPWAEGARHPLFFGLVGSALALVWLLRRGWRGHPRRSEFVFYAALAVLALLFALGPGVGGADRRFTMPFSFAYFAIPGFSLVRDPVRFTALASLAVAVMAGGGLAALLGRRGRRARGAWPRPLSWVGIAVAGLAAVELFAGPVAVMRPLPGGIPPIYNWIGSVSGDLALVELPMPRDEFAAEEIHARYQLYSLAHNKRLANGIAPFDPPLTRLLRSRMQAFPDQASVAMLRELGITYVLIHADHYPPDEQRRFREGIEREPGLAMVDDRGAIWVVDVVPGRGPAPY